MSKSEISVTGLGSVSPLGVGPEAAYSAYLDKHHYLGVTPANGHQVWAGLLDKPGEETLGVLRKEKPDYEALDRSVLLAILAGRLAVKNANWASGQVFGVNFGSSRGATGLFEAYHSDYTASVKVPALASPTTTLGNIASWVAQDLMAGGPELSHSITCSTALHAVLNGVAWLRSGMSQRFLCGGSEAPVTGFTIAQMQALKIYSRETGMFPSRPLDPGKPNNSMVLGEGAAAICLEPGQPEHALAYIRGMGYATEPLDHAVSLSADAGCLQKSMKMALDGLDPAAVDVVILHAPGTRKGDEAELKAVRAVFGVGGAPAMCSNKWKIGHTLGASGMLSLELAILMLCKQQFIGIPYLSQTTPKRLRYIMVNAVGFGANAVSILLERP